MTSHFAHLRQMFERCADLPVGERARWLDTHVPDTAERIEIELMLAADTGGEGFLRRDVVSHIGQWSDVQEDEFQPEGLIGRRFGAFELQHLIGRGGQGAVYVARRVGGDFEQTAAVKLLRRGLHDSAEHKRFRREREILARFEHPGVARLIDGGVSAEGVPYLVMEHVEGLPIDRWCEQQGLDRAARLRLLVELCEVVAAAQRALIVHRDLKPSNVLVTGDGAVKVLDFGIARLLDEDDNGTQTNAPAFTPGYGAPEQASGGVITLATDVHALGVLLRVLLTGTSPTRVGAQAVPDALPQELRWIVAKACAAEPPLRYRDAAELSEDISRFLAAKPVHAHPPSRWYSMRKFVARHRGGVMTTAAVLLALLASFGIALWQARVAREQARIAHEQAQRAQAARDFLLSVFEAAQEDLPKDARPTPDMLVKAAAKKLEGETQLAPALRADFLTTLGNVAKTSNDPASALPLYEKALATLEAAGDRTSREHLRIEVLRAWVLLPLGRATESENLLRPRLAALRAVVDDAAADGVWAYADALGELGRMDDYLQTLREARELARKAFAPDAIESLRVEGAYSLALSDAGRLRESAQVLEAMLQRWRAAGITGQADYAISLANLALLKRRLGDLDAAVRLMREALQSSRRLHDDAHPEVAGGMQLLGRLLSESGEHAEAETLLRESEAALRQAYGPQHPQSIAALSALGVLDLERQHYANAAETLQRAADVCVAAAREAESRCITNTQLLGDALLHLGRIDAAAKAAARSLELRGALAGEQSPDYAIALRTSGDVQLAQVQPAQALASFDTALDLYAKAGLDGNLEIAAVLAARARALLALARAPEALAAIDRAATLATRLVPRNQGRQLRLLATRAAVLAALSRTDEARASARAALALEPARAVLERGEWEALQVLARP